MTITKRYPKVSVIIPSYNHGRFLRHRLESILAQTYQDFDLHFLDDASTDNSVEVFREYQAQHPWIQYTVNEKNSGSPFVQWNKGVRAARGEYIWLAESDDACDPKFLEQLVAKLDAHPEVGLAYANSVLIDESNVPFGDLDNWLGPLGAERWHTDHIANGPDECRYYLSDRNVILNASGVVFRKSLYEQIGGADESMRLCGDWATWVKILSISDAAYIAAPLNHFRMAHAGSVRHRTDKQLLGLTEKLTILAWIDSNLGLPADIRDKAAAGIAAEWNAIGSQMPPVERVHAAKTLIRYAKSLGDDFTEGAIAAMIATQYQAVEHIASDSNDNEDRHRSTELMEQALSAILERLDAIEATLKLSSRSDSVNRFKKSA